MSSFVIIDYVSPHILPLHDAISVDFVCDLQLPIICVIELVPVSYVHSTMLYVLVLQAIG